MKTTDELVVKLQAENLRDEAAQQMYQVCQAFGSADGRHSTFESFSWSCELQDGASGRGYRVPVA